MINSQINIDKIEFRKSRAFYFYPASIFVLAILVNLGNKKRRAETVSIVYPNFSWESVLFLATILCIILYLAINILDRSVKLKISDEGIWTKKNNIIPWTDIWYLSSTERNEKFGLTALILVVKMKEDIEFRAGTEIKISLSTLEINIDEFWKCLNTFCNKYGVISLGHDKL